MNIEYKNIQQIRITAPLLKESNEIEEMNQFCIDNGYSIIQQGCPINPETLLPDITQYIIIAQLEV